MKMLKYIIVSFLVANTAYATPTVLNAMDYYDASNDNGCYAAAFMRAIASLPITGGTVTCPNGQTLDIKDHAWITVTRSAVRIQGRGPGAPCVLRKVGIGGKVIDVTGNGFTLENVNISFTDHAHNNSWNNYAIRSTRGLNLTYVKLIRAPYGIYEEGGVFSYSNLTIENTLNNTGVGVYINQGSAGECGEILNSTFKNTIGEPSCGVYFNACAGIQIGQTTFDKQGTPVLVQPGSSSAGVFSLNIDECTMKNSSGSGIKLNSGSKGIYRTRIGRSTLDNCDKGIEVMSTVKGLVIYDCEIKDNDNYGIVTASGAMIDAVNVYGCEILRNGNSGIKIGSGGGQEKFMVVNNIIHDQNYGVNLDGGNEFVVYGNDIESTTQDIRDNSGSSTKVILGNY